MPKRSFDDFANVNETIAVEEILKNPALLYEKSMSPEWRREAAMLILSMNESKQPTRKASFSSAPKTA